MLLVYLDRYHLGDPLFVNSFAQHVKAHEGPLALVHGGGEDAERALEAAGLPTARAADGTLEVTPQSATLVERAVRELGRRIVHALNDAGVPALRLSGTDRGLLRRTPDGVAAGRVGWLTTHAQQGVVPVIALLVPDEGAADAEIPAGDALVALLNGLQRDAPDAVPPTVILFPAAHGSAGGDLVPAAAEVADTLVRGAHDVRVARPAALRGAGTPVGTVL